MSNRKPFVHEYRTEENQLVGTIDNSGNAAFIGDLAVTGSATDVRDTAQTLAAAGAVSLVSRLTSLTPPGSSSYAISLAAPSKFGVVKVIECTSAPGGAVTLALTNVVGGSAATTASFDNTGEVLVLISSGTHWVVVAEVGVTLS